MGARRGVAGLCLALAALSANANAVHAQNALVAGEATQFYFVPFGGLPHLSGMGEVQQAIGAHLIWPFHHRLALSSRYEVRWRGDGFHGVGSLDVVGRLVGTDTTFISIVGGWARWDRTDYSTLGVRAAWPLMPPPPGRFPVVQAWFDLRYTASTARELYALEGRVWTEVMLSFVLPIRIGRW